MQESPRKGQWPGDGGGVEGGGGGGGMHCAHSLVLIVQTQFACMPCGRAVRDDRPLGLVLHVPTCIPADRSRLVRARGAKGNWCQKSEIETLSYGEKCDLTLREMAIACDSDIVCAGKAERERERERQREREREKITLPSQ